MGVCLYAFAMDRVEDSGSSSSSSSSSSENGGGGSITTTTAPPHQLLLKHTINHLKTTTGQDGVIILQEGHFTDFGNFNTTATMSGLIRKFMNYRLERHENWLGLVRYQGKYRRMDITICHPDQYVFAVLVSGLRRWRDGGVWGGEGVV